jgi:hypothetical protein
MNGKCLLTQTNVSSSLQEQKNTKINYEYKIHNQDLEKVPHSKYLGVTLSKNLSWKPHINNITKKSNKTLGFLRKNLHSCTHKVKEEAFTTLIRPSLDYASSCWDPQIKEHTDEVGKVQRRGARFVFNNYKSREPGCATNMLNTILFCIDLNFYYTKVNFTEGIEIIPKTYMMWLEE